MDSLYTKPQEDEEISTVDERVQNIQTKIKELEKQLHKAKDEEKASLQTQIGVLFAQLMNILEM